MAGVRTGLGNKIYVGGYDLSGDFNALNNLGSPRGVMPTAALNANAMTRKLLHTTGHLSVTSFWNDTTNQVHTALASRPTTDQVVVYSLNDTIGDPAAGLVAKTVNYDPTRNADGSLSLNIEAMGTGSGLEWGELLTAGGATETGAADGASKDDGAGTTNGLIGYLEVTAFTGTDCTIKIQMDDNSSFTSAVDAITFTQVTGRTAERIAVSTTTIGSGPERYLRYNVSTSGGFTTVTFVLAYRRGTANDDVDLS